MTTNTIDRLELPALDEQGPHVHVIKDNTPDWYSEALDTRKTELASLDLAIPDWYKKASASARDRMREVHARSRRSLNQLDRVFSELKQPAEYAEPLLVAAIEKKFGQRLDVNAVFYARKMEQKECNPGASEVSATHVSTLASEYYFYRGISLLEAALNNFIPEEAIEPVCEDCHLITRYNFYRSSAARLHPAGNVRSAKLDIKAHEFAQLCRELNLGQSYYEHVRTVINQQIQTNKTEVGIGKLYSSLITSHRNQLELAAEIALMKGDIQPDDHRLINDILIDQLGAKRAGETVKISPLRLCSFVLENILIIGPVVWRANLRNAELLPRACMVCIPGDPLHSLKAYDNIAAFTDHLTTRLCCVEYRKFFSQFVPLANQDGFFTQLKGLLDPDAAYTDEQDFAPAQKGRIHHQGTYAASWRDVWMDCAMQRIRLIMNNASTRVVSTQDVTDRAYKAWLWSWGSTALDILNLVAFVVPPLGEVMLVVAAVQMAYEIGEGIEAWSEYDAKAAWAHLSAVGLNLAMLAVPKVLMAAKDTAFVRRLVHVEFGGRTRLYDFNPAQYLHRVTLPEGLKANAHGLYAHESSLYLPATDGGHYKVEASGDEHEFRLLHPDGASRYTPRIRHNGEGAWVHEFEQPLTWDRKTLLRRIGHSVDHLSDTQLEQARAISGVSDDELRQVFTEQRPPAPLFKDMLRRFEFTDQQQYHIDQLSHPDHRVRGQVHWSLQVKLLTESGSWPASRVLVAVDGEGNRLWSSGREENLAQVVTLKPEQLDSGHFFAAFSEQLSESEMRHLLGEELIERRIRRNILSWGRKITPIPPATESSVLNAMVEEEMEEERIPATRARRYRDRLVDAAISTRGELFNREMAAGDVSSDAHVQLIQRSFPGVPKLAAEEIVTHASGKELASMTSTSHVPLRLAEEARHFAQRARVMRAHADLLFENQLTMDGVHLALHKMASVPELLGDVCIELRADTYDGPLLDRVGETTALRQCRLIRTDLKEWKLYSGPEKKVEYWRSDKDAFFSALWMAGGGKFTRWSEFNVFTQTLKKRLGQQPLNELASRRALGLQAIKPGFKSPMRLADGRIGYPLSPVGSADVRPLVCRMKAMALYPSKSMEEVEVMLGLQGAADATLTARLTHLEGELAELDRALVSWQEEGSGYSRARRRVSGTIKHAWRRGSAQAVAGDQTPIGHVLDLSDEDVGELPAISANMDHVGSLVLRRMALSNTSLPFLKAFGGLRWLNLSENNLTELPEFAQGGVGLTKLNLSRNDIQLTEQSRLRLQGMQGLKILKLGDNPRLGWHADLRGLRNLNQVYLPNTGTTRFPDGAEQLPHLARIDLHTNRITTLPEYAYQHLERINLHDNPLSAATLERLQLDRPLSPEQWGEHVSVGEARGVWLGQSPTLEQARRGGRWDELKASAESAAFFTVLADTTRSAEYASPVTRPALAERVWDMLEAASENQGIRETLFAVADDRVTCGDGSLVEFMNLESELLAARALESVGAQSAEGPLISTARKLFRLSLVDAIAHLDVEARGPGFTEQVEVILAYRIRLADRLELPVKSRDMLFSEQARVSPAAIDEAYAKVLRDERIAGDEEAFFVGRMFWETHLRTRYPQEIKALMVPAIDLIDEKSSALFDLADLQDEPVSDAATQNHWQTKHDEATDRLAGLLGKRRNEILVNGSMQSAFYERELKQLGAEREALEQQALKTLTRKVLNNFAASEGTSL
ncbi:hypothetical protein HX793_00940 [Pseudomonas reactans]|uniref:NEL-type E3 ubiquitin ligase domain-containing protein n=1 Tax=Pseudomonas reactans TaxID=117680 RepID=UPI0015A15E83|nr:NEL-type E3 ubiquitin ligase domain-containing protein [Pseudomonas reactans]NWC84749.1 hypothetical protein [Pseudomonas reactans]NWD28320.1 hypothetical protein [Pseudomonas reactans]